jgi:putative ABC transport system permease protein
VALLLALGCANVAGLLLVQMSTRQREMAVRMALGGSRRKIAQQLLWEAMVLATIAGTAGLVLGLGGARALVTLAPDLIPRLPGGASSLVLDRRLAALVCLLTTGTVVACLILPMLVSTSVLPAEVLRGNGWTQRGTDRRGTAARSLIVATQVAIAAVLTIGAALLGSTWWALQTVDRGFNAQNVATLRTSLSTAREAGPDQVAAITQAGLERLLTVPGVVAVAATCCLPLESDWLTSMQIVGSLLVTGADELPSERRISPGYFDVLEIPVLRGRPFSTQDSSSAPRVAIVNQAMARRYWPGQDPIGAQVRLSPGQNPDERTVVRAIVGVVADVRDGLVTAEQPRPTVYVPLAQVGDDQYGPSVAWIVRHHGASVFDRTQAERVLRSATGGRPVFDSSSLEAIGRQAAADTTLRATLLTLFSAAALLLAGIGVYGAVSAVVRQRWHELGVRLALGGQPARLRQLSFGMRCAS